MVATDPAFASRLVSVELAVAGSGRRGRAFLTAGKLPMLDLCGLEAELALSFADADDAERLSLLQGALARREVTMETYRGESAPHELHAYVRAPEVSSAPLFACVLAPPALLDRLVSAPPHFVLETACLQALGGPPTTVGVVAALEEWVRRVFPHLRVPTIRLSPWPGPVDTKEGTLEILRLFAPGGSLEDAGAIEEFSPPPYLVNERFLYSGDAA